MAAASSRALLFYRLTDLSNLHRKPLSYPYSHNILFRPSLPYLTTAKKRPGSSAAISCLISGIDGDDFISTNSFYHEFSVIANMLKRIEPLDISVISKGASNSAKDSMKRMISSMLGLIPPDQFSVTITVSKRPLVRLLSSSIITGYALWNAEYRIKLMRNFETSAIDMPERPNSVGCNGDIKDLNVEMECCSEELERLNIKSCLADLSPDAMNYIQELESQLSTAKKDLHTQKQETMQIGYARESNNDILKYLGSLDSDMMNELSRPSSSEVKEILQQLVQCTSRRVFMEHITSGLMGDSEAFQENYKNGDVNFCETPDYLAKLLFWCMLLGHQLRGLENRLYLRRAIRILHDEQVECTLINLVICYLQIIVFYLIFMYI
ncbi:hypothetical protein L1987_65858 [Smallanthus sonchifolius]|uniref:Uncharacterized protein n=1 Tax=Smallanthus sonchifolius TaxID=185202 RepID=A0ACB9BVG6_9ASTR|nr:hypothetical protein L1987_65858 [Smallanthus sonchifolius]